MISVDQALAHLFDLLAPLPVEEVALAEAANRVLARPVTARRDQPPFAASAMDGYAMRAADAQPGARLRVVGEAAAGRGASSRVEPGVAMRIFTGAPLPPGADRVVIQEDVCREGDRIVLGDRLDKGPHVRPAGADFTAGHTLSAPRRLRPADLALAAAMNVARLPVHRRPDVALIATGDELVMPGETPGPDQMDALLAHLFQQPFQAVVLIGSQFVDLGGNGAQLLGGGEAVRVDAADTRSDLPFQAGHPHHIKFIQVAGGNGKEAKAFKQRVCRVHGFFTHAAIEFEPGQFPVDEPSGRITRHVIENLRFRPWVGGFTGQGRQFFLCLDAHWRLFQVRRASLNAPGPNSFSVQVSHHLTVGFFF